MFTENSANYEIKTGTITRDDFVPRPKIVAVISLTALQAVEYIKKTYAKGENIHYMNRSEMSFCNKNTNNELVVVKSIGIKDTARMMGYRLDKVILDARVPIGLYERYIRPMVKSEDDVTLFNIDKL